MSAVFTLRTAIFLTVTSAAFASNITLYNSSTTGTPPARAMPLLKRGERSLVKDDYNLIKVKGSNNGAVTVWPDGSINITSTEASKTHHRYALLRLQVIYPAMEFLAQMRFNGKPKSKIVFKGKYSQLYICMNEDGKLYSSREYTEECRFDQIIQGPFYAYCCTQHKRRTKPPKNVDRHPCMGFNNHGRPKPGYSVRTAKNTGGWFLNPKPINNNDGIPSLGDLDKYIIKQDKLKKSRKKQRKLRRQRKKKNRKDRKRKRLKASKSTSAPALESTTRRSGLFASSDKTLKEHRRRHQKRRNRKPKIRRRNHRKTKKTTRYGISLFSSTNK